MRVTNGLDFDREAGEAFTPSPSVLVLDKGTRAGPGGWHVEQECGEGWTWDRQQESAKARPCWEGKVFTLYPATVKGCGLGE